MTTPIPLKPMVWDSFGDEHVCGEYEVGKTFSGEWLLRRAFGLDGFADIASDQGRFHPTLAAAQAAAEADRAARIAAELDPARLTQWAAGVLLADAMACLQLGETVTDGEAAMLRFMDTLDRACVINALQVLAGEAGQ